jgi:hypothetical protein
VEEKFRAGQRQKRGCELLYAEAKAGHSKAMPRILIRTA